MRNEIPLVPGRVVRSRAGRDEGRYFVVLSVEDGGEFAFIADGDLRKSEKPKRKRARHLTATEELVASLQKKLMAGEAVENFELRNSLAAFKQKEW